MIQVGIPLVTISDCFSNLDFPSSVFLVKMCLVVVVVLAFFLNSLTAKSCYGGEKHQNPVGFYGGNSTESTLHKKQNNRKHHHHGGAVCPSYGVGSMYRLVWAEAKTIATSYILYFED
jgi:hypothetical protein